jgi:formiminotetrahydrofolate cyclodeaminase
MPPTSAKVEAPFSAERDMQPPDPNGFPTRTIADYAALIASASPTPGGGSVAASVGAFACALGEMVCNVTLSGTAQPENPSRLRETVQSGSRLRGKLLGLAAADERAYGGYQVAWAMPKATEEEKRARKDALELALAESTTVPIEIARTTLDVLEMLLIAAEDGTTHARSDVSTGAVLAEAAIRGALFTAGVNVAMTKDNAARERYRCEIESLTARMTASVHGVLDAVDRRMQT